MVYLTSDLHGYPLEGIKRLLDKAGFTDDDLLFILGDVIDRGEHSIELLKWIMPKSNVRLLLGNHEAMLLSCSFLFDEVDENSLADFTAFKLRKLDIWQSNGGYTTIRDLQKESHASREAIIRFLEQCPLYETVSVGGKDFLLVHGGLGGFREDRPFEDYSEFELLWSRPELTTRFSERFTTVIGHTPTIYYGLEHRGRCLKTDTWIDIDAGASGGLSPMLLRLDDMQEFYND